MDDNLCPSCEHNPADAPHVCPFQAEIHGDDETLCACCDNCTDDCARDI